MSALRKVCLAACSSLSQRWAPPLAQGWLCPQQGSNGLLFVRGQHKRKNPLDPKHAEELPTFQYVSETRHKTVPHRVYLWGCTVHGAIGIPTFVRPKQKGKKNPLPTVHHPVRHQFAEKHRVIDISCGYGFTHLVTSDGRVFGMGLNSDAQLGIHVAGSKSKPLQTILEPVPIPVPLKSGERVVQSACGRAHALLLTSHNEVLALGSNSLGQCGRSVVADEDYFRSGVVHRIRLPHSQRAAKVFCGQDHSLVLSEDGELWTFGWSCDGQTGRGLANTMWEPGPVRGELQGKRVIKVSSSSDCVLALTDAGEVYGWGNSEYGQLLTATSDQQVAYPQQLSLGRSHRIVDVAAGATFCAVLDDEGDVWVWGYGYLGLGPRVEHADRPSKIPPAILQGEAEGARVTSLHAGPTHLMALNSEGHLYAWGRNTERCLGLGHDKDQTFPSKVCIGARIIHVSCGADHNGVIATPFVY